MLAQRISSINSISTICEATGADIDEIAYTVGQDSRIGHKLLQAGLGFGGSCFKKDILNLVYMANTLNLPEVAEYWMQVLRMNDYQRNRFVKTVVRKMNSSLIGRKLAVFGLAFKEDTNDSRESPAIEVVKELLKGSPKEIVIFDPGCNPAGIVEEIQQLVAGSNENLIYPNDPIRVVSDAFEACQEANAVLLLTPWSQFRYPAGFQKPDAFYDHQAGENAISNQIAGVTAKFETLAAGSLQQLVEESLCGDDCRDCSLDHDDRCTSRADIPWVRIAEVMKKPSLVFDARGLVDVSAMEEIGFKVRSLAKSVRDRPFTVSVYLCDSSDCAELTMF
jgi:UDPglucose 6-dehydrogenase